METLKLDITKRYTFADYLTWADDVRRELIDGFIKLMSPAPMRKHQQISGSIYKYFSNYLDKKKYEVYFAPFDVRLPKKDGPIDANSIYTVVQPDITVICDPSKLDDKGCIGAPDLIVEILSPSSAKRDLQEKYAVYQESGVKEYWIVYPDEKVLHVFLLDDYGEYQLSGMYTAEDKVRVHIFNELVIDLANVFVE